MCVVPGSKEFVGYWTQILSYLSRFLSPPSTREYSDIDETASTFQHIAIWTILQFCESDGILSLPLHCLFHNIDVNDVFERI